MATTRFDKMNQPSTERSDIAIVASELKARCHNCHIEITPNKIVNAHTEKPMHVCPKCRSVIQENNYVTEKS